MTSPVFERVRQIAADVLEVPAASVKADSSPESIDSWDSVHHLNLILALEEAFEVQLEPEEIDRMNSVGRIVTALESKLPRP